MWHHPRCRLIISIFILVFVCGCPSVIGCQFPCAACMDEPRTCPVGVSRVLDGCQCCHMCARQHGQRCNTVQLCDFHRHLACVHGRCQDPNVTSCVVNGHVYTDGERFKPDCRTLCTCQGGRYVCTSLCAGEAIKPDSACYLPVLASVRGQCCRQWTCHPDPTTADNITEKKTSAQIFNSVHLADISHSKAGIVALPKSENVSQSARSIVRTELAESQLKMVISERRCRTWSNWSECSTSCNLGFSSRRSTDTSCWPRQQQEQQLRLCQLRQCWTTKKKRTASLSWSTLMVGFLQRDQAQRCKPTHHTVDRVPLLWRQCRSVRLYRPAYCAVCPGLHCRATSTSTKLVQFMCPVELAAENHTPVENGSVLWTHSGLGRVGPAEMIKQDGVAFPGQLNAGRLVTLRVMWIHACVCVTA